MSDYKVTECIVSMKNPQLVNKTIMTVCKLDPKVAKIETDATIKNKWSHTRKVDICIRQDQMPEHLRSYGDIGFVMQNGKYAIVGLSQEDVRYVGVEFKKKMDDFLNEIQSCYGMHQKLEEVRKRVPGIKIDVVQESDVGGNKGWKAKFSIPPELAQRMGVKAR